MDDIFIQKPCRYSSSYTIHAASSSESLLRIVRNNIEGALTPGHVLTVILLVANSIHPTKEVFKQLTELEWNRILEEDPRILQVVEKAIANKDYKDIYNLSASLSPNYRGRTLNPSVFKAYVT